MSSSDVASAFARFDRGARRELIQLTAEYSSLTAEDQGGLLDGLAERAALGSRDALDVLLEVVDNFRLAVPSVRRLVADDHSVEEIAQDVLVAIARSISNFEGRSAFRSWMYGVSRNQAKLFLRGQSRRPVPVEPIDQAGVAMHLSSLVARRETLDNTIQLLPLVYRDAVVLRDVEQLTYAEIGQRLGIEVNTVRSRIARGRALLSVELAS